MLVFVVVSLSAGGGKYACLRSLNLTCDHPDHYKEWIEGVSAMWKDDVLQCSLSTLSPPAAENPHSIYATVHHLPLHPGQTSQYGPHSSVSTPTWMKHVDLWIDVLLKSCLLANEGIKVQPGFGPRSSEHWSDALTFIRPRFKSRRCLSQLFFFFTIWICIAKIYIKWSFLDVSLQLVEASVGQQVNWQWNHAERCHFHYQKDEPSHQPWGCQMGHQGGFKGQYMTSFK